MLGSYVHLIIKVSIQRFKLNFTGKPGDVFFYPGLIQHCSMPNKQREGSRTGILMQFLPKWVIPMEDFRGSIQLT